MSFHGDLLLLTCLIFLWDFYEESHVTLKDVILIQNWRLSVWSLHALPICGRVGSLQAFSLLAKNRQRFEDAALPLIVPWQLGQALADSQDKLGGYRRFIIQDLFSLFILNHNSIVRFKSFYPSLTFQSKLSGELFSSKWTGDTRRGPAMIAPGRLCDI